MTHETEPEQHPASAAQADEIPLPDTQEEVVVHDPGDRAWSPGVLLKQAREQQGLSQEELAAETKFSLAKVRSLEEDDFGALDEPVYTRGHYRRCAQALGLSAQELVKAYERASGESPPQRLPLQLTRARQPATPPIHWLPYCLFMLAAACLVVAVMWWGPHSHAPASSAVAPTASARAGAAPTARSSGATALAAPPASAPASGTGPPPVADNTASTGPTPAPAPAPPVHTAQRSTATETSAAAASTGPAGPQSSALSVTQTPAPSHHPSAPAPTSAAPATTAHTLKLAFHHACWVRITDARGKTLLRGLMNGGTTKTVKGKPPYDVLLGYAPGVKVTYGGHAIALSSYQRSNNTAHLSVGSS